MTTHTRQGQPVPRAKPADMRDYRFYFNSNVGKWCIEPAAGGGTEVLMCDELNWNELDVQGHPDGTMSCTAELIADGHTLRLDPGGHAAVCKRATLRLLRVYDQMIHIPVVGHAAGGAQVL